MRILIVEDDKSLADLLVKTLSCQHYQVELATDSQAGWDLIRTVEYDVILLDLMLPRLDGISICQRLRHPSNGTVPGLNQSTPILLLTAEDSSTDKVKGLDAGADDYMVKPIQLDELLARIRALLRRQRSARSSTELPGSSSVRVVAEAADQPFGGYCPNGNGRVTAKHTPNSSSPDRTRAERLAGSQLSREPQPQSRRVNQASIAPELQEIWNRHGHKYSDRITVIEQVILAWQSGLLAEDDRHKAHQQAHTLIGSLGSFGFMEASQLSRQIEGILRGTAALGQSDREHLMHLVVALRQQLGQSPSPGFAPSVFPKPEISQARLLIVEDDVALAEQLALEAKIWGVQADIVNDLAQAHEQFSVQPPDVVLLDLNLQGCFERGLELLADLQHQHPAIPVLVLTAEEEFASRVRAARLGCKGFLQKPITPAQIFTAIAHVLQTAQTAAKILIVDDDPELLTALHAILEPWGFRVTLLDKSQLFWKTLEQTAPDLLILDVNLTGAESRSHPNDASQVLELSGIDLCRVVRNDPQWSELPILFLSACVDAETVQRGFAAGADDYVSKPISPTDLLTRVINRLERGQRLRQLAETDELTGVSNRRKSVQELTRFLYLAQRQQQPFSLAVIDLDHFKTVNDRYGHDAGDHVLSYLGTLLKQTFRQEDVVGRWGGEEFVIGMYGMVMRDSERRLIEVLDRLSQEQFRGQDGTCFRVTASAGVAHFPVNGQALQTLYQAADAALYQAKAEGRNRVVSTSQME